MRRPPAKGPGSFGVKSNLVRTTIPTIDSDQLISVPDQFAVRSHVNGETVMQFSTIGLAVVLTLSAVAILNAQSAARELQDLVGARVIDVAPELEKRGYERAGAERALEFWRKSSQCIGVSIAYGRVLKVAAEKVSDCDKAAANKPTAPRPTSAGFSTMCGAMVNGKPVKYRCTLEGVAPGGTGTTVLSVPDSQTTITMTWPGGDRVTVTFAGMKPQETTYSTSNGITRFVYEHEYFFASDRSAAERELKTVR